MKKIYCIALLLVFTTFSLKLIAQPDSLDRDTSLFAMSSYIDSIINTSMNTLHIPGAVISIVKDDQLFYNGYGYADLESQIEVDRDKTGFRIASITKTFTATAALQLVEQGKLDLNKDVSHYLPDRNFGFLKMKPITMHQLLTHTAGFDFTDIGDAALTPDKVIPLEVLVRKHMPKQVHEPGTVFSYSNFGYALAGYIIQEISEKSYEAYIIDNLLDKLEMSNSEIHQPLPAPNKENLAKSYRWENRQILLQRDFTNTLPGGGIISTAKDMSHYLQMHLNHGEYQNKIVLSPDYHTLLTSQQYGSANTRFGICYAWNEGLWLGRRVLQHTGGQLGFLSLLVVIPEENTGIFIAHNSREGTNSFRYDIAIPILEKLLGRLKVSGEIYESPPDFEKKAKRYEGLYKQMNYPKSTYEKISQLFGMFAVEQKVKYLGNGILEISGEPYAMVKENLFLIRDSTRISSYEFKTNENGEIKRMMTGTQSFEKIPWFKKTRVVQITAFIAMFILIIQFLARPVTWLNHSLRKSKGQLSNKRKTWLNIWMYWTASLFVLGFLGLMVAFGIYKDQMSDYGVPLLVKFSLLLNTIAAILSILTPFILWKLISMAQVKRKEKIISFTVTISILLIAIIFWQHNIVGFHY